jgi:hypothetical protein
VSHDYEYTDRMLEALFFIVLTVALGYSDPVINIIQPHAIVSHVPDRARTTSAIEVCRFLAERVGPDLDTGALGGVVHRDIPDENVLHDINTFGILSERSDRDAMCAVTGQVLNKDIRGVWLERNAICECLALLVRHGRCTYHRRW